MTFDEPEPPKFVITEVFQPEEICETKEKIDSNRDL